MVHEQVIHGAEFFLLITGLLLTLVITFWIASRFMKSTFPRSDDPDVRRERLREEIFDILSFEEATVKELAAMLHADVGELKRVLLDLEGRGRVERRPDLWQDPDGDDTIWQRRSRRNRRPYEG